MEFEWDPHKAEINWRKHKIAFDMAARVFLDAALLDYDSNDESGEMRYSVIGMVDGRLLHVTYTMRVRKVRIISARLAERHERRQYHEV